MFLLLTPNISSLIVPPISSSSTGAVWLVIGVCEHRSVPQHHQEVSLLSGWQIPTRGQTALWKRWRTMSSSSLHCKIHTHQLLIYMIFVALMKCLFPLQSSGSCKTMQVSVIYISIRFEIWTTVQKQPYSHRNNGSFYCFNLFHQSEYFIILMMIWDTKSYYQCLYCKLKFNLFL